jgi:hypothetical protein
MSDVGRVQWGIDPEPGKTKKPRFRGRVFRLILWFVFGLFAPYKILEWIVNSGGYDTVVSVLGLGEFVKVANGPVSEPQASTANLLLLLRQLLPIIGTVLFNTLLLFWLPFQSRILGVRLTRTMMAFFSVGLVVTVASLGLAAAIMPRSTLAELMIIPSLVLAFFVILTAFSPFISFWPVNVPDNRVWMIMDSGGHLLRYAGAGTQYVTPMQYAEPFDERGVFTIGVDDESYVSSDAFPYRLRLRINCMFDPLAADQKMWVSLRDMTRSALADDLQTECEFIVRHEMAKYWRDELSLPDTLHTIAMDISEAIKKRQHLGVSLVPINGVNVILDPPEMIVDSRARRMFLEALAIAGNQNKSLEFKELLRLVSPQTNPNVAVNPQGQVTFNLMPGAKLDEGQIPPTEETASQEASAAAGVAWQPAGLPSGLEATQPMDATEDMETVGEDQPDAGTEADDAFMPPANPIDGTSQVIDTDIENGIFVPRDPLLRPKSDKPND